jgi:cytoskeleton protein RodZ
MTPARPLETAPATPPPEGELSLGRELRRAREVRGFSLEQIAAETKIKEQYLHALENDRIDLLPGRVYARNWVRSYARVIGADEEELLDYFSYQARLQDAARGEVQPQPERLGRKGVTAAALGAAALVTIAVVALSLLAGRGDDEPSTTTGTAPAPAEATRPVAPVEATPPPPPATSSAATVGREAAPAPASVDPAPPPPPSRPVDLPVLGTAPATAGPQPAGSPAPAPADAAARPPAPVEVEPAPLIKLVFNEESWIEVFRGKDREPIEAKLRGKGTVLSYRLDEPVSIKLSNAGGVQLLVDGRACKPLGGPREARQLTLDRRNYRALLLP